MLSVSSEAKICNYKKRNTYCLPRLLMEESTCLKQLINCPRTKEHDLYQVYDPKCGVPHIIRVSQPIPRVVHQSSTDQTNTNI